MEGQRLGIHESIRRTFPPEKLRDYLAGIEQGPAVEVVDGGIDQCDALVTLAYEERFVGSGIRWLHSIQSGVDRFPFEELEADGVALTNSAGVHDESVGETVAGYMLMFARLLHRYRWNQRDHRWDRPDWHESFTLGGASLCVVGLGALGTGIAERASALGMEVTGVKRTVEPVEGVDDVHPPEDLLTAIDGVDFVALAVPLTDKTEGLIGPREFAAMRDDAYLVNVARGQVVDQSALIAALREGELAGAALDVFETEPLPEDSPLWGFENVVVTPHTAGLTRDYYRNVGDIVRENVTRLADDRPLVNRVV